MRSASPAAASRASRGDPAATAAAAAASSVAGAPLTIDQLAVRTGVPSRTIRFYQTQGALPAPQRRGRIAVYTDEHVERLRLIEVLQSRGLRLSAIADLVRRGGREGLSVGDWLGLDAHLAAPWSEDRPETLTRVELLERIAPRGARVIPGLVAAALIIPERGTTSVRVPSPALLALTLQLDDAGIDVPTAAGAGDILRARLAPTADELVRHFAEHAGRGFGRRLQPSELDQALEALRPLGVEAVRLIFAQEMERALRHPVANTSAPVSRRPAGDRGSTPGAR